MTLASRPAAVWRTAARTRQALRTVPPTRSDAKKRSHISNAQWAFLLPFCAVAYILVCIMSHLLLVVHVMSGSELSTSTRKSVKKLVRCCAPASVRPTARNAVVQARVRRRVSMTEARLVMRRQHVHVAHSTTVCVTPAPSVPMRCADAPPSASAAMHQTATSNGQAAR
jgi:hypothetical protein